jgi:signal transduction histidine kinase
MTESGLRSIFDSLGWDINDPKNTFHDTAFKVKRLSNSEATAGNPLHVFLLLFTLGAAIRNRRVRTLPNYVPLLCSLVLAFVLFCFFLRWQPWNSRLHLPLFVLSAPLIAAAISGISYRQAGQWIMIALIVVALPYLFYNWSRPLVTKNSILLTDREDQYFRNRPVIQESYREAVRFLAVRKCDHVGLRLDEDDWEYPLWVLMQDAGRGRVRLDHVDVENETAMLPIENDQHCALIQIDDSGKAHAILPAAPE